MPSRVSYLRHGRRVAGAKLYRRVWRRPESALRNPLLQRPSSQVETSFCPEHAGSFGRCLKTAAEVR